MDKSQLSFVEKFSKELTENNASVFIGAGLSKASGYVDWKELLRPVAKDLGLDIDIESDLITLAQYSINKSAGSTSELSRILIDNFSDIRNISENHRVLARLPIRNYWTTNYDKLIEKSLEENGRCVDIKSSTSQLSLTKTGRDAVVYKIHGDIDRANECIISKDSYEKYFKTHEAFVTALAGELVEKTFLFLGYSFNDPNIDSILSRIRITFQQNQRKHYCIFKRSVKLHTDTKKPDYNLIRQELFIADLKRFNIESVLIDDYSEITKILLLIERNIKRRTVFISGSAVDYGTWGRENTENILSTISSILVENNYKIATGFGLGIGAAVVSGAIQKIYTTKNKSIDDHLILRPFPIYIKNEEERNNIFNKYRIEMISRSGIAIFFLGNKSINGEIRDANGMIDEFNIAKDNGCFVIPIGCSGFVARKLWQKVIDDPDSYISENKNKILPLLNKLGNNSNPTEIIQPLFDLLCILSGE